MNLLINLKEVFLIHMEDTRIDHLNYLHCFIQDLTPVDSSIQNHNPNFMIQNFHIQTPFYLSC